MNKWYDPANLSGVTCPRCGGTNTQLYGPPNHLYPACYKCYDCSPYGQVFHVGEPEETQLLPTEEAMARLQQPDEKGPGDGADTSGARAKEQR